MNPEVAGVVVAVVGVAVAIGAWLWPREKSRGSAETDSQSVGYVGQGQLIQAGRDVIVHQPSPRPERESFKPSVAPSVQPSADVSVDELYRLLKKSNAFREKDIFDRYRGKTFRVRGGIESISGSREPILRITHDTGVGVSVSFRGLDPNHFDHIQGDSWFLDCIAPLEGLGSVYAISFGMPEWYEVKPHGLS